MEYYYKVVFQSLLFLVCYGYYEDIKIIKDNLLENYNSDAVPVLDSNMSLTVNVSLYVMALQGLDEKSQILTTSVFWFLSWHDIMFRWNNTKYSDITRMTVKVKDVWVPDIFVVNAVKDMRTNHFEENDYVNVISDGVMKWFPANELKTSCAVDISKYPFDVQTCTIRIESWYHDSKDFVLKPVSSGIETSESHFVENGEWEITHLSSVPYQYTDYVDNTTFYTGIEYFITLKPRFSYHLLTTVFPFLTLMFLNTLTIIIPTESGEKLGFCMSQFLTMIVFLTLVAESMPASSLTISYFKLLVGSQIVISGFSTLFVSLSIYFQTRSQNTNPNMCLRMILLPFRYLQYVYHICKEGNAQSYEQNLKITWKHLDHRINCVLKVTLLINITVSLALYSIFVWYS